jgi:putative oxidoreductase
MTFSYGYLKYIWAMEKLKILLHWLPRIIAALIMLQTLFFKFTGSEESVFIFTTVGMEPYGRIGVGILELIASVLILINTTAWLGAALALGLMGGAIMMHVTMLGIEVRGDGGQLFVYALIVAVCSGIILLQNKTKIQEMIRKFSGNLN